MTNNLKVDCIQLQRNFHAVKNNFRGKCEFLSRFVEGASNSAFSAFYISMTFLPVHKSRENQVSNGLHFKNHLDSLLWNNSYKDYFNLVLNPHFWGSKRPLFKMLLLQKFSTLLLSLLKNKDRNVTQFYNSHSRDNLSKYTIWRHVSFGVLCFKSNKIFQTFFYC